MELRGTLLSLRTYNNWALGTIEMDDGAEVLVVGQAIVGLTQGLRYLVRGKRRVHPTYGEQFEVFAALPDVQPQRSALVRYLTRQFHGCAEKSANRIVDWFETNATLGALSDILASTPWLLADSPAVAALGRKIEFISADECAMESRIYRHMALRLGGQGVPDAVLRRLATFLHARVATDKNPVEAAWALLSENPYAPMMAVEGYGFAHADAIGRNLGILDDAPARLGWLAYHVLHAACEGEGHVFLPLPEFASRFLARAPTISIQRALACMREAKLPIVEDGERLYLKRLLEAERYVASRLREMTQPTGKPIYTGVDEGLVAAIAQAEFVLNERFGLDDTQRQALAGLLRSKRRLHTVTAAPGCGKTALMEIFIQVATRHALCFAAPTGKAAKVLTARIIDFNHEARTVHATLEPSADGGFAFTRNENNPLAVSVLIIDESSMQDLPIFSAVLKALPEEAHLILLGDPDQLASVGPGDVLANILCLEADHHRLDVTHRNQGGILQLVRSIRQGRFDLPEDTDVEWAGPLGDPAVAFDMAASRYIEAVAAFGIEQVGFLIARRKGKADTPGWNTTYANAMLQQLLNPDGQKVGGTTLRIGDRIIIRRNLCLDQVSDAGEKHTESVVNGDTGCLKRANYKHDGSVSSVVLDLDDGREIALPGQHLDLVSLAYATTVHAAQGSEYQQVILVVQDGAPGFMNRQIIYTAASRPRTRLTIFGDLHTLKRVAGRPAPLRYSELVARVQRG